MHQSEAFSSETLKQSRVVHVRWRLGDSWTRKTCCLETSVVSRSALPAWCKGTNLIAPFIIISCKSQNPKAHNQAERLARPSLSHFFLFTSSRHVLRRGVQSCSKNVIFTVWHFKSRVHLEIIPIIYIWSRPRYLFFKCKGWYQIVTLEYILLCHKILDILYM